MDLYRTFILCSNARPPVAHLIRATYWHSENPGSYPRARSQRLFPTPNFCPYQETAAIFIAMEQE